MSLFSLTEEKLFNIFKAIELGMPKTRAAVLGNVSQNAFQRYFQRGTDLLDKLEAGTVTSSDLSNEDALCVKLVHGMDLARSKGLQDRLQLVNDAGSQEWRASAWVIERTEPKHFGKRTFEEVTQFGVQASAVSIEDVLALKRAMADWEKEEFDLGDSTDS